VQAGDYYPTLPVAFRSASNSVEMIGDFDTGSSHTFVDHDFLLKKNIIRPAIFHGAVHGNVYLGPPSQDAGEALAI
jgi:hypothetical protein